MAESPALRVVLAYQNAWTSRDFETAARYVAEDVVFDSPQRHLTTQTELLSMLTVFSERIAPRWEMIAATTAADNVLILYNLFTLNGVPATCADYFVVEGDKIASETLVFDPQPFAAVAAQQRQVGD